MFQHGPAIRPSTKGESPLANPPARIAAPPIPAPYLARVPRLPRELQLDTEREPTESRRTRSAIRAAMKLLKAARRRYEAEAGVEIKPEPVLAD